MKKIDGRSIAESFIRIDLGGLILSVIMPVFGNGAMVGIHYHSFMEIHVVQEGTLRLYAQGREYELPAGRCCLLGANVYHYLKPAGDLTTVRRFSVLFECKLKKNADSEARAIYERLSNAKVVLFENPRNIVRFEEIGAEMAGSEMGRRHMLESLFGEIILSAARAAAEVPARMKHTSPEAARAPYQGTIDDFRDQIISDYFCDNLKEALTPDMLAKEISVSPRHLARILLRLFGKPFKDVLIDTRLEAAKDFLVNTDKKVGEIAEEVGYKQTSNFYRIFRERIGTTPLQFRNSK